MPTETRYTVCTRTFGRVKKWCQYRTESKAKAHAATLDGGFVILAPLNPERKGKCGGRRSTVTYMICGLPQYD